MPRSKKPLRHPHVGLDIEDAPLEVIASSIIKLADGIQKLNESGLTEKAVLLLLHDATGVNKKEIAKILKAAPLLADRYVRPDEMEA